MGRKEREEDKVGWGGKRESKTGKDGEERKRGKKL